MENKLTQFVRGLYFDIQTIEGVQPLEIWNGVRESFDSYEMTLLVKNLYKVVLPLVNERCFGRAFDVHSRLAKETVCAVRDWFCQDAENRLFQRFPYPPTGEGDQKALYRMVKERASNMLEELDAKPDADLVQPRGSEALAEGVFPDGLFDFREMRLVDNELPYIIFTDKEFKVIHGLAIVYLWLIDLDVIFLETLEHSGVDKQIIDEYRQFGRRVHKENPLTIRGRRVEADELIAHIKEKLRYEDYLDLFENVYAWFEQVRDKFFQQ